jgi:tripeptide aminopeptidase
MPIETVVDRFQRYVRIDTQSEEDSKTSPSTAGQFDLARLLAEELRALGLEEVTVSDHCVVMATLPSNLPPQEGAGAPVIGFIAHLDTSPAVSGANVKPQLITYPGGDISLPGDPAVIIRASECPELERYRGKQIITSDGTTLLGADDKAGIAAIMQALATMRSDPSIRHGKVRIAFTPDEEVGHGTDHFDIQAFGAALAYTVDGGAAGELENETFCADNLTVTIRGRNQHPGYAKGIMVNAVRVAAELIARLPRHRGPEHTEKREPYLHADSLTGNVEQVVVKMLARAFTVDELHAMEGLLDEVRREIELTHPQAKIEIQTIEAYRNMRYQLDEAPAVVERALEAIRRVGLEPRLTAIRGGTDGARLSAVGLPTPNLFAGGMNFHAKTEWVAVEAMEASSRTIVELCRLWCEKPETVPRPAKAAAG